MTERSVGCQGTSASGEQLTNHMSDSDTKVIDRKTPLRDFFLAVSWTKSECTFPEMFISDCRWSKERVGTTRPVYLSTFVPENTHFAVLVP